MKEKEACEKNHSRILTVILTLVVLIGLTVALVLARSGPRKKADPAVCNHTFVLSGSVDASEFSPGKATYRCSVCGAEKTERSYAEAALPQIYFDGNTDGIAKDHDVRMRAEYVGADGGFTSFATIKYQGHTALGYDKKNYTVKFFTDEDCQTKNKLSLHGWSKSHKYCLKANYIDFSQSRNLVSNQIWREVVAARENLDSNLDVLQCKGAIDGYPVMVFLNDEYQGVYTLNIPKDDDTYGVGDDPGEALFVINSPISESAHFRSTLTEDDRKTVFDLEYCYGDENWAYDSLNNLISFVINHDGAEFREGIGSYLDVDSAIDYLITAYCLGLTDNFCKNTLLLTYNGERWILSLYDMDTAGGLAFDGTRFYDPAYLLPVKNRDGTLDSATDSLLWDRILNNYPQEIKARYGQLRSGVLDPDSIIGRFETFIRGIPQTYYEKDLELWGDIPLHDENGIQQIKTYFLERSRLLDAFFNGM